MMKETDAVIRAAVDAALDGRRSWENVSALASEAGTGDPITYKAIEKAVDIGAITRRRGGGFSVTDPERLMMIFSARRSLEPARRTTLAAAEELLGTVEQYAIGGTRAAAHHLGGPNTIADYGPAIIYVRQDTHLEDLPDGDGVLVLVADDRSLRAWKDGYTSPAQTYADLFAQPGWQASEFRRALWRHWFTIDDWTRVQELGA